MRIYIRHAYRTINRIAAGEPDAFGICKDFDIHLFEVMLANRNGLANEIMARF